MVSGYDVAAMSNPACVSCESLVDPSDNFCRRCGAAVEQTLPAVRPSMSTTIWQPAVSPVVKGAAVMAAGTVGQFLFRRAVSTLLNGGRSRKAGAIQVKRRRGDDGMVDEAQIITETIMMRRVRVRRQA
jgi:hypothetical protein